MVSSRLFRNEMIAIGPFLIKCSLLKKMEKGQLVASPVVRAGNPVATRHYCLSGSPLPTAQPEVPSTEEEFIASFRI